MLIQIDCTYYLLVLVLQENDTTDKMNEHLGSMVLKEWQLEVKKARRGCLITICNHTSRVLVLTNSKISSGKWSDGFSIGSLESAPTPATEPSIDVPVRIP